MNTEPTTLRKKPRTISVRKTDRQRGRVKMGGKRKNDHIRKKSEVTTGRTDGQMLLYLETKLFKC